MSGGMSFAAGTEALRKIKEDAEEANSLSQSLYAKMEDIANGLGQLQWSGFDPNNMMDSAFYLANEIKNEQERQRERIFSLLQGCQEMLG